ncbi:NACHT domain-containing protein [Glycomyces xiaoerkulensis]|uniref:NACHT domain-containing protein n=1 Tax=Glycomyces xiaoerkulensis TaxID=2038139 RepID=UPI000C268B78|nr:NACHT domain-containing protein [Glycomyces xiaoerkulensis]
MSIVGKVVAWILGLAGVPATWLLIQQNLAQPWLAAILFFLFEAVIGLGAMVVSVAHQTIRRRLEQIANVTDLALGRSVSRYARHYRRYILEQNARFNARDLAHTPSHIPELDAIYVDVGLAPDSPSGESSGIIPLLREKHLERFSIQELLDTKKGAVYAVIGAPGSGKTTLLRYTARRAASAKRRERKRRVPVLLALRDHAKPISDDPGSTLADVVREDVGRLMVAEPSGWWEAQLRDGNCLILLDGLDEVAGKEDRFAVSEWIEQQIAKHPGNDFVITSRPHGYQTAVIPQAVVLQVRPFTTHQIHGFVRAWCLETERLAIRSAGPETERRAEEEATGLLGQLATAPVLQELAVNPLLLTMMVLVHRERRALPEGRADLYHQLCDVMLWRRAESKKLTMKPSGAVRQGILAALAYEMMIAETRDFPREQVLEVLQRQLDSIDTDITPDLLLESIVESSGLLVERERDLYAFTHQTIGEYLASTHIRTHHLTATLIREVDNAWWRETTLLFIADSDANAIVEACLERDTGVSLSLAFDCLRNHGQIHRSLRDLLDHIRQDAFRENAELEHRRRIARALAAGHLSKLVALDNTTLICPDPISEDLYWLFCKDTGTVLPEGFHSPDPQQDALASGMWRTEANRFIEWVNVAAAQENAATFRLPSRDELAALKNRSFDRDGHQGVLNFAWTRDSSSRSESAAERSQTIWTPHLPDGRRWLELDVTDLSAKRLGAELMLTDALTVARILPDSSQDFMGREGLIERLKADILIASACMDHFVDNPGHAHLFDELRPRIGDVFRMTDALGNGGAYLHKAQLLDLLTEANETVKIIGIANKLGDSLGPNAATQLIEGRHLGSFLSNLIEKLHSDYMQWDAVRLHETSRKSPASGELFAAALYGAAGLDNLYSSSVEIDDLSQLLAMACESLDPDSFDASWLALVAAHLRDRAAPILDRTETPTLEEVQAIRLSGVLLTAVCLDRGHPDTADLFRKAAFGFTKVEDRIRADTPLEVLVLARE